jgi:hypothetical protein
LTIDTTPGDIGLSFVGSSTNGAGACFAGNGPGNNTPIPADLDEVALFVQANNMPAVTGTPMMTAAELVALTPGEYYLNGDICWTTGNCTSNAADLAIGAGPGNTGPPGGTFDVIISSGGSIELASIADNGGPTINITPEPATYLLLGVGLLGLVILKRAALGSRAV